MSLVRFSFSFSFFFLAVAGMFKKMLQIGVGSRTILWFWGVRTWRLTPSFTATCTDTYSILGLFYCINWEHEVWCWMGIDYVVPCYSLAE